MLLSQNHYYSLHTVKSSMYAAYVNNITIYLTEVEEASKKWGAAWLINLPDDCSIWGVMTVILE